MIDTIYNNLILLFELFFIWLVALELDLNLIEMKYYVYA